jgi:threonylcarbamoyladenosine tRNA methylthiotransferase MtaB
MEKVILLKSLGCRLNMSELESIATTLKSMGHRIIYQGGDARYVVINSCAVTLRSERKTRNLIYRSLREEESKPLLVIVTGCFTEKVYQEENILYIPNDYKYLIPAIINNELSVDEIQEYKAERFSYDPPVGASRNRVNLKIQDGCSSFCSYCYIPYVRGESISRPLDSIVSEFSHLIDQGFKEIILTGVQIGSYLHNNITLAGLVEKLLSIEGNYRLHIPSLAPMYTEKRLLPLFTHHRMVKHMNLSLQSGSNRILKLMKRPYSYRDYISLVETLRKDIPNFNLTTDVIVGFPSETEEDFRQTLNLIHEADFTHIHTFRYSSRPGTEAAKMEDQVREEVKKERSDEVIALYKKQKKAYYSSFHRKEALLLTEQYKNNRTTGHTEYYLPVEMEERLQRNIFQPVLLTHNGEEILHGEVIESS